MARFGNLTLKNFIKKLKQLALTSLKLENLDKTIKNDQNPLDIFITMSEIIEHIKN